MNISWEDARLFLAVAESGSFSGAATLLGLGQPTVSRRIAELEYQLGWSLFHRGKRGTRLSEDGERMLPAARQMARWATEFERSAASRELLPSGVVRLASPPGVAFDFLVQVCQWLMPQYPDLRLEVRASVEHLDLARGDADIAVRSRPPNEPELARLGSFSGKVAAFGAEDYVATLPKDVRVQDIAWVTWCQPYEHLDPRPQLEALIDGFVPAFSSDNYLIQMRACELGLGAMFLGDVKHPMLRRQGLRRIELKLPLPEFHLHLVTATSLQHVPRVRVVADALAKQVALLEGGEGTL